MDRLGMGQRLALRGPESHALGLAELELEERRLLVGAPDPSGERLVLIVRAERGDRGHGDRIAPVRSLRLPSIGSLQSVTNA